MYIHMPKVFQHFELYNISYVLLEYFKALFCFNKSDSDVIFAMK